MKTQVQQKENQLPKVYRDIKYKLLKVKSF